MDKLTHRTCRATAPSVLSLFVNRSVGNSCRAGREREGGRERKRERLGQSPVKEERIRKRVKGKSNGTK